MMRLNAWKRWSAACVLAAALTGSGIAVAGILAGPGDSPPARSPAATAIPRASAVAVAPEAGAPPAAEGREVSYEVAFLEAPGLSFREMGLDFDFRLDPPAAVAFLSDLEVDLLTRRLEANPNAAIVRAPGVSTPLEAQAVIVNPAGHGPPSTSVEPRPTDPPDAPAVRPEARAQDDRRTEGCTVRLEGRLSADERFLQMRIKIRDLHVVQVHTSEVGGRDAGREGRRIEVPEVVRTDVDSTVTIPDSGAVLIGLGLSRTVDDAGASTIAERLVLIRPRGLPIPPALPAVAPPPALAP